jgi:acetylglutamate kinase
VGITPRSSSAGNAAASSTSASNASACNVLKLGGRALEAPGALAACAGALRDAAAGAPTLVVHGGGAEVSTWCERAGVTPRFADGLRVTDPATLEIAAAVLAGLANKRLVAALRACGVDAVGVSALDGGIVRARRHANAAVLGEVGEVAAVDVSLLRTLLAAGHVPVLASLGDDGHGALLNLNADDVAAAIAGALAAADLVLLSDTPGLVLDGDVVRTLDSAALEAVLARTDVTGGMRPKLRAAAVALAGGVARVHIAAWSPGTTLAAILDGTAVATTLHASHDMTREESHA